jgi:RNA polymerase nonessential primary-like sigma factor
MSQNTLKVNELHDDVDFDENSAEAFDEEKATVEESVDSDALEAAYRRRRGLFCTACAAR